jgi:hypothetical protein
MDLKEFMLEYCPRLCKSSDFESWSYLKIVQIFFKKRDLKNIYI